MGIVEPAVSQAQEEADPLIFGPFREGQVELRHRFLKAAELVVDQRHLHPGRAGGRFPGAQAFELGVGVRQIPPARAEGLEALAGPLVARVGLEHLFIGLQRGTATAAKLADQRQLRQHGRGRRMQLDGGLVALFRVGQLAGLGERPAEVVVAERRRGIAPRIALQVLPRRLVLLPVEIDRPQVEQCLGIVRITLQQRPVLADGVRYLARAAVESGQQPAAFPVAVVEPHRRLRLAQGAVDLAKAEIGLGQACAQEGAGRIVFDGCLVLLVGRAGVAGEKVHTSPQIVVHRPGGRRDLNRLFLGKVSGRRLGDRLDGTATREKQYENDSPTKTPHDNFQTRNAKK